MNYIVTKLVSKLLLPPGIFVLLLALGILVYSFRQSGYSYHRKNSSFIPILLVGLLLLIYLFSSYIGEIVLTKPLEDSFYSVKVDNLLKQETKTAIVVLGGGIIRGTQVGAEIGRTSLKRLQYGWELQKKTGFNIVVTGGVPPGVKGPAESKIMEGILIDWGTDKDQIITETKALNTWLNATNTTKILQKRGYKRIVLVTSATHMKRAVYSFKQNWNGEIVTAPTDYIFDSKVNFLRYIPNRFSLHNSLEALHEWIGLAWYHFKG
ncbi:YdcF family protein [Halanaerocella petrolearia]